MTDDLMGRKIGQAIWFRDLAPRATITQPGIARNFMIRHSLEFVSYWGKYMLLVPFGTPKQVVRTLLAVGVQMMHLI